MQNPVYIKHFKNIFLNYFSLFWFIFYNLDYGADKPTW
jgi:hypothetical protein